MFASSPSIYSPGIASKKVTIVYVNGPQRLTYSAKNISSYLSMNSA